MKPCLIHYLTKGIELEFVLALHFINFKTLIVAITLVGTLGVIVFQKIRPAYYNTTSIATSGIAAFERID